MCCIAANLARSFRATAPMLRWDQSWHVLVLLLKLQDKAQSRRMAGMLHAGSAHK
jgi:hypothetical protein